MDSQLNVALGIKGVAYSSNFLYNNCFSLIFTNTEVRSIKVLLCNIHNTIIGDIIFQINIHRRYCQEYHIFYT
jgi:hypothetical protein